MGQTEIEKILKRNKGKWISTMELRIELKQNSSVITRSLNKMLYYKEVERRHLPMNENTRRCVFFWCIKWKIKLWSSGGPTLDVGWLFIQLISFRLGPNGPGLIIKMGKKIHIAVSIEGENTHSSFYFKDATVGQLYALNSEIDVLKKEIIDRIKEAPKDYEIQDFGEGD